VEQAALPSTSADDTALPPLSPSESNPNQNPINNTSESSSLGDDESANHFNVDSNSINASVALQPWQPEVTYEALLNYEAHQLQASLMYHRPQVPPIVLACMGIGVPTFPRDIGEDPIISKSIKKGKGQLFNSLELLPTNKTTGRKVLLKELIRRKVLEEVSEDEMPRCKHWTINSIIEHLQVQAYPPPIDERDFILGSLVELRNEVEAHYCGVSHAADAALNRHMRFVEVILHPSIARDWRERNMQKNRQVLDATCSHSSQLQTNEQLISVWIKATKLYNDPTLILHSRVFSDFGDPFDEQHTLHPVGEGHRLQPETFRKKYTDNRGVSDKLRGNLCQSGEGQGSYKTSVVRRFTDSEQDYYTFMSLQEMHRVDDFCQSLSDDHAASMKKVPATNTKTPSAKKSRHSSPHPPDGFEAVNRIANSIEKIGDNPHDRLRDLKELLQRDEALVLEHQSKLGEFGERYAPWYEKFEAGEISDTHFLYKLHKNNYEACEANVFEITQRIEKAKTSINDLEEEIKQSQQCRFQTPQPNVGTGSGLADTHDYLDGMTDDELGIFNNYPNGEDEDVHQGVDATVAFNDQDIHDPEEIE
jgi:hypothetical protein